MSIASMVFATALAVAGCSSTTPASPETAAGAAKAGSSFSSERTGVQVELRFDETAEYQDLKLRWLKLEDSRCPTGVTCVWEGQVVMMVEALRGEEEPVEVRLLLRPGHDPEATPAFVYALALRGVDPHPRDGITPRRSDYLARIEITEP